MGSTCKKKSIFTCVLYVFVSSNALCSINILLMHAHPQFLYEALPQSSHVRNAFRMRFKQKGDPFFRDFKEKLVLGLKLNAWMKETD